MIAFLVGFATALCYTLGLGLGIFYFVDGRRSTRLIGSATVFLGIALLLLL